MAITIEEQTPNRWVLRIAGLLQKAEWESVQAQVVRCLDQKAKLKIMFVLDNFRGWQRGADWGDVSFFIHHGDKIEKIAIVGDPKWEGEALMFAGAGFRKAPVKYFPTGQEQQARTWID